MAFLYKITRDGRDFFAAPDTLPPFFVGRRVPYKDNIGLYNIFGGSKLEKLDFKAADFTGQFGFWAEFIEPTALCEGRNFLTLNTYDRAAFTFGFGQFAAHVPDGDFVEYLRSLLSLPDAGDYFPHLVLSGGHICSINGAGQKVPLEDSNSTNGLMKYLNPTLDEVEDAEVIAAARLIHFTSQSKDARAVQVDQMVKTFKSFMKRAEQRIPLDGRPAEQCCLIADVLHQGRGGKMTWPLIAEAMASAHPFDELLAIGSSEWDGRRKTLKKALAANANFQAKHWNSARHDFA
ncbi:hypothetical protein [Neorhizobium alkalisoli]|uniref:Uncharacterized protein n=1 Tax=Neorhizobium alkalisoli TaxID=528178 RepID=A0A561R2H8_9HYPH|nr:hypothetical protein [Neorhizobium alkalisoli]TWF56822.1 hypothetical protein FHW37_102461 [Neorhizobium alkalisoli]